MKKPVFTKTQCLNILGLSHGASMQAVKASHRTLAMKYHPDHYKGSDAIFKDIQTAYEQFEANVFVPEKQSFQQTKNKDSRADFQPGHSNINAHLFYTLMGLLVFVGISIIASHPLHNPYIPSPKQNQVSPSHDLYSTNFDSVERNGIVYSLNQKAIWVRFGTSTAKLMKCDKGYYAADILNQSKYTVSFVSFFVYGTRKGHSTKYNLNQNLNDQYGYNYSDGGDIVFSDDTILAPGHSVITCFKLNNKNWPKGQTLYLSAEIQGIEINGHYPVLTN